jgi:hypothetical protein
MEPKVIDWDGSHIPEELQKLPPGKYAIESIERLSPLTVEEEAGILDALNELDAGGGVPLGDVVRAIRAASSGR